MHFSNIKVFGERNSGTNFLSEFLRLNIDLNVLEHRKLPELQSIVASLPPSLRTIAQEKLIDHQRMAELDENYGWKHSSTDIAYLQGSQLFETTMFIFIVRNPYAFLNSLYRRPYNALYKDWRDRRDFLRTPWLCNLRDRVPYPLLESPVQLWNYKNASYLKTHKELPDRSILIRYEDLVTDPGRILEKLQSFVPLRNGQVQIPEARVKKVSGFYVDYLKQVKSYTPTMDFSPTDITFIKGMLDEQLFGSLYPPPG